MLTLKFDKDTGRMIGLDAAGYPLIPAVLKRRETVPVSITLYSAGVPAVFSGGTLSIGLKALGLYSGTIAANVSLTLSGTTYSGDLSLSTTTIATLFAGVGLPPTEPDFVSLAAEVTHSSGWTAEAITLRCDNDYIVGGETLPGDEVLTAADRVQTGLDRVQTGLDRVQTGLDRASASDSAATASTQAGLASGYKADAEAAAAAAEALALVQVDIRAQSTPPDDTTVLWLDESEESPMSADVIAAAASADSAAASAILTAADRVQTGLDRTQASSDRASATASQAAAAASAANALAAISQAFKGGVAGGSVPATSTAAGDTYRITAAGTSQSKTWVIGDAAIYNGSSGNWVQLTGFFAGATVYTDDAIRALKPAGYIQSDGATSTRSSGIYGPFDAVNNPREYVSGAASLTDAMVIPVPTASSTAEIVGRSSSITALSSATGLSMSVAWSGNDLVIRCNGATPATDFRTVTFTGLRTTYSGQTIFAKAAYTNGTTAPVFSVNGVTISGGTAANGGGTTPDWLSTSLVPTYRVNGYNWPAGPAPIVTPILGTTSAADDAFYMATGKWPAWVVAGGSAAILPLTTWSGDGLSVNTATAITGTATNIISQYIFVSRGTSSLQLTGNVTTYTGGIISTIVVGGVEYSPIEGYLTGTGAFVRTFTGLPLYTFFEIRVLRGVVGGGAVALTGIAYNFLGALSLPAVQPINVIDDVSGIGGNQGRLLGCSTVTDKRSTCILGRINAASATNQQILGGAVLPVPLNHAIEFVDVECDGSVTLSLGDGTTATRYTASTALTAGRTRIALTTPFAADAAKTGLYVNVTVAGGTYAQFSILGHLLK